MKRDTSPEAIARANRKRAESARRYQERRQKAALVAGTFNSIQPVNRKRRAKLYVRNFGEKAAMIRGLPCDVTGRTAAAGYIIDPAHMQKRSGGGDASCLVPLWRVVHTDFDDGLLSDEAFATRWGRTRASIRDRAWHYEAMWREVRP